MAELESVRLTQQVKAGGCASKLAPGSLAAVLSRLPKNNDPNLLVGFDTSDDAGIYRISAKQALVQTVDFFTPLVDDAFTFGEIAATNALSDVYAKGGHGYGLGKDGGPVATWSKRAEEWLKAGGWLKAEPRETP